MHRAYLVIVRCEGDTWVVDEDSYHNLEDCGSNVLELQVQVIRPLVPALENDDRGEPVDVFS